MQFKAWYDKFTDTITITEDDGGSGLIGFILFGILSFVLLCILVLAVFFIPQVLLIQYSKKKLFSADRSQFLARGNAILSACYGSIILYLFFCVPDSYSYMFMLALAAMFGSIYSLITSAYSKYKLAKKPPALDTYGAQWIQQCRNAIKISTITLLVLLTLSAILVLADPTFLVYF